MKDRERRVNKKYKMKENKKFPYKKSNPFRHRNFNIEPKWMIINENGNIIEKFRSKGTAVGWLSKLKEQHSDSKLEIVLIK